MSSSQDFTNIVKDISLLYELSLSVGQSLDLWTNCDQFLKTLMARKNLDYSSVWISHQHLDAEGHPQNYGLVYANPEYRVKIKEIPHNHPVFQILDGRHSVSLMTTDEGFPDTILQRDFNKGACAIFRIGDIGILKLFSLTRTEPFHRRELNQLRNVVDKFTVSLEGCLSHERVKSEIAERKMAEAKLRESEERYRDLVEKSGIGILIDDSDGKFEFFNERFPSLFGFTRKEILNKSIHDLVHPDDIDNLRNRHETRMTKGNAPNQYEFRGIRKNGSTVHLEVAVTPLTSEDEVSGSRSYLWDISDRKQQEQELQASLREKTVMLQEIHHRVKNNLQVISSLLALEAASIEDDKSLAIFNECRDRVRSMSFVHEELYQSSDLSSIDFSRYINRLTGDVFSTYTSLSLDVKLRVSACPIQVSIDQAVPCGLIINELVTNALKYGFPAEFKGNPIVIIKFREMEDNWVELIVQDNGVGLPESFNFADNASLGLELVSILAEEQLKGKIVLGKGRGTKIIVQFPIKR